MASEHSHFYIIYILWQTSLLFLYVTEIRSYLPFLRIMGDDET